MDQIHFRDADEVRRASPVCLTPHMRELEPAYIWNIASDGEEVAVVNSLTGLNFIISREEAPAACRLVTETWIFRMPAFGYTQETAARYIRIRVYIMSSLTPCYINVSRRAVCQAHRRLRGEVITEIPNIYKLHGEQINYLS